MDTIVHLEEKNNKICSNLDMDLEETIKLVEIEAKLWVDAQVLKTQSTGPNIDTLHVTSILGHWCFSDGS